MSVEVRQADPLVGLKLGDYVIEALVGEGGMGLVYRAVHPLIGRRVAVKVLRPEMADDPEQAARFLAEARALSAVKHRGVIDVISFGHLADGRQYMVMEFLEGEALDAVLEREGSLSPVRAVSLVDEVLEALSAAHKAGVVHRDIKPSNVFLLEQTNGTRVVKVVDFGLARRASLADLSRTGDKASLRAGTPEYISPEQVRGLAATPRSDLYSVGVMLFELLSGRLPFEDRDVGELIAAHVRRPAPRVSALVGGLPDELVVLLAQLLEKRPEDRPESADVVHTSLQRVLRALRQQETQVAARPRPASRQPAPAAPDTVRQQPTVRLRRLALVLGGALGLLLLALAAWPRGEAPAPVAPMAPVAATPPVEPEPDVDELAPLPALPAPAAVAEAPVAPTPTRQRPAKSRAPASTCAAAGWRDALKERIAQSQQEALAARRLSPTAEAELQRVYLGVRDGTTECPALEASLSRWRAQHLRP